MTVHEVFRTHQLTVERIVRAPDAGGGWPEDLTVVGEVTGSLQPASGSEQVAADVERTLVRWMLYCDPGTDVARSDELTHTASWDRSAGAWVAVTDGRRFRVVSVGDWDAASVIDHMRVDLEEVQRGR